LSVSRESPRKHNARGKRDERSSNLKAPDAWSNRSKGRITPVASPRLSLKESDSSSDIQERTPETLTKSTDRRKMVESQDSESMDEQISVSSLSRGNSTVLYTDEEVISNSKRVITDYFEEESPEDAVDSLKQYITSPTASSLIISQIISLSLDKKEKDRQLITELFPLLKSFILVPDFEKAFDDSLVTLEDLVCDIPKAADYLGYLLAHALISNCISEDFVKPAKIKGLSLSNGISEGLLGLFFKTLNQKDITRLKTIYSPFNESLHNFVKKDRFFKAYGLEESDFQPSVEPIRIPSLTLTTHTQPATQPSPLSCSEDSSSVLTKSNNDISPSSDDFVPTEPSLPVNPEINHENYLQKIRLPRGRGAGAKIK